MTINNFDQRVSGSFSIPRERLEYVRNLERRLKASRAKKSKAKSAG
ncbi:hypothetical protein VSU19_22795 [Verrucomicrobiales bacterium BCK34]|nr:hypothetical protein [Verrucomicrobiales bacterium BCK34]